MERGYVLLFKVYLDIFFCRAGVGVVKDIEALHKTQVIFFIHENVPFVTATIEDMIDFSRGESDTSLSHIFIIPYSYPILTGRSCPTGPSCRVLVSCRVLRVLSVGPV